jgi:hypothetical protein
VLDGHIESLYVTASEPSAGPYGSSPYLLHCHGCACSVSCKLRLTMMLDKDCTLSARYPAMKAANSGSAAGSLHRLAATELSLCGAHKLALHRRWQLDHNRQLHTTEIRLLLPSLKRTSQVSHEGFGHDCDAAGLC